MSYIGYYINRVIYEIDMELCCIYLLKQMLLKWSYFIKYIIIIKIIKEDSIIKLEKILREFNVVKR